MKSALRRNELPQNTQTVAQAHRFAVMECLRSACHTLQIHNWKTVGLVFAALRA